MPADVGWYPDPRIIRIQKWIAGCEPQVRKWRKSSMECYRFRDGKQLSEEDERQLQQQGRPTTAFNVVQKFINYVSGVQRESPLTILFEAVDFDNTGGQLFGERVAKYYQWARQKCNAEQENSTVFADDLTGGMGWERGIIGKAQDPRGLVILPRLNPFKMLWDTNCEKINLGGSCAEGMTRFRAYEDEIDIDEAKMMFRSSYAHNLLDQSAVMGATIRNWPSVDRVPYIIPYVQTYPLDSQVVGGQKKVKKDRARILEIQWWDQQDGYVFIDPIDQTEQWMTEDQYKEYEKLLDGMGAEIKDYAPQGGLDFQTGFLLNRRFFLEEPGPIIKPGEFEDEDFPLPRPKQGRFTMNCMCGHFDEEDRIWYGFLRALMDPQRWGNKFFNQTIELYGRQAKGGAIASVDAFEDKAQMVEFVKEYTRPGTVNLVADPSKIIEKKLPETPAAALTILKFIQDSMPMITGIATDAIGSGAGTATSSALGRRQRAGMVLLANEFDCEALFRRDEALIVYDLLHVITDDRLIRVAAPEGGETVRLDASPYSLEYEISIDEVERDPNLRQYLSDLIMGPFGQTAMRTGRWIDDFYNWMPIPRRTIEKLKQKDAAQQQQMQQFAAMGLPPPGGRGMKKSIPMQQAETENKKADTQLKLAKAKQVGGQQNNLSGVFDMLKAHQEMQHKQQSHQLDLQAQQADLQAQSMKTQMDVAKALMMRQVQPQQPMQNGDVQQP